MGESVGAIELDLELNDRGFDKSVNSIAGTAKKVGRTLAAAFAIDKIVGFGKECLDLGSDLAEVQNVVDVAFGPTVSKKINSFAKSAAQSFGLSETMAKKYAGTFGSMATAFGFSQDQAADMSTQLTGLAGDVASFYNISQDEAYTKLKSVFTGETESLKDLGVVMTQTALDSYAMANGFGKTTAQMSEAEKVALRYSFVQNQLSNAAGDFARTSDSWANQTRILALQFDSLRASIGQGLINLFQPIIVQVNALLKKIVGLSSAFVKLTELLTGKKSSDNGVADTADMAAKADDNMSGAAKSANTLTKNTKAAGKAAKKAAKEMFGLASWDELSNNTSSKSDNKDASSKAATGSSGGSTSKAPSGSALDDTTKSAGKLSTALDAVRKKFDELKKLFVKGFQIGLGNTSSVFKSIKNELKSIGKTFQSIFTDPGLLTAASNCVNKIVLALGKITGSIASIGLTIADNLLGGISLYLKQHKKDLIEDLTALFNITGEIATIVGNFSVVLAQIATVFRSKDAKLITASIISIFAEAVTNVAVLVAKFGKDVLNLITSPIIANKDAIKKALSNTIAPVSKIIQSISAVWSNTWTKIQTFYNQHISPLFATITGSVTQWIQTFLNGYNQHIAPVLSAFATKFKAVMEQYVQPAINAVIDAFGDFVDVVAAVWKAALQPLVNWCIAKIVPVFAKLFKTAGDIIIGALKGVSVVIKGIATVFSGICKIIKGMVTGDWTTLWNGVKNVLSVCLGAMKTLSNTITKAIVAVIKNNFGTTIGFFKNIASGIKGAFSGISNWFKNTFLTASGHLKNPFSCIGNFFEGKYKDIKKAFSGVGDWFSEKFKGTYASTTKAWSGAKDAFKGILANIKAPFKGIADWFEKTFGTAWTKVKAVFSSKGKIFDGIKEGIDKTFKAVVNTLIKGLNVIVEKPFTGINKMLNKLRTAGVGKLKPFAKLWNENPIAVPKIPALAQGGYVRANTPQLAMIGDNKRYGEIVAPENKLQAMVDRAVQMSGTASATALVPVIERLCNAIIELEQNGGSGIFVEKYKEGDLLKVVRQENNRYKRQHGASALI